MEKAKFLGRVRGTAPDELAREFLLTDARFHEVREEGDVAGETIQLGDYQRSAMLAAELEGGSESRPIIALAALHLQNLLH